MVHLLVNLLLEINPVLLNRLDIVWDYLRVEVRVLSLVEAEHAVDLLSLSGRARLFHADVPHLLIALATALGGFLLPVSELYRNRLS